MPHLVSRLAARLALASLSLLSLAAAACSDAPVGTRAVTATPERVTSVELNAGDSLDLTRLAWERYGMLRVSNCASDDPAVAEVGDADRLLALAGGQAMVRCVGALDGALDGTIPTGAELPTEGAEERWVWVTFDVSLHVIPVDGSATDTAGHDDP